MVTGAVLVSAMVGWGAGAPTVDPAERRDAHENLHAVLWMQTSAEYQALTRGIYKLAASQLDRALADPRWTAIPEQAGRPDLGSLIPAVILDVDETVLDNSPSEGQRVLDRTRYEPDVFAQWVTRADAEAIPGADVFIRYALSKGVQVYLVTNRQAAVKPATVANLAKRNMPIGAEFVLCRGEQGWDLDKSSRRQFVASNHRVLLMAGDDLGDFVSISEDGSDRMLAQPARAALVDRYSGYWEDRWMVLPNPAYGSWERIFYSPADSDAEQLRKQFGVVRGLAK
jgi:acid phosphatase